MRKKALPLFSITLLLSVAACTGKTGSTTAPTLTSPREALGLLSNDFAVLVDVREADALKDGMAEKALAIPSSQLDQKISALPTNKQVVVYCSNEACAKAAAEKIAAQGLKASYFPSFEDWKTAGLPVKTP